MTTRKKKGSETEPPAEAAKSRADKRKKQQPAEEPGTQQQAAGVGPAGQETAFPIVGIGASAGGVQALDALFEEMPADCPMAFVVIQHLDPHRESLMSSLLSKTTDMPINEAREGLAVEPGQVYIKMPGSDIVIRDRTLSVLEGEGDRDGSRMPIDVFFRSLAEDQQENAICVVLTGASTDGTLGAKAVKGEGGLVVVQDETQAQYDRMPRSVIEAGLADLILPVEQIPEQLLRFAQNRLESDTAGTEAGNIEKVIRSILMLVRTQTGHDFSNYKHSTVRRRIERRMVLHNIQSMPDYRRYLRQDSQEVERLFTDLTINVTRFFRDAKAFGTLKESVLKPLLQKHDDDTDIRIWVPACSSGEEAYSIAMLIVEMREELEKYVDVKIFATDINSKAIETARSGSYPESVAADIPADRLKRFFGKKGHSYRVDSKIREMVVFADHDVIRDPPFSNLDLISCRNLLIYMNNRLQRKLLPVFHYALKPEGYLFLGTSETAGESGELFTCLNKGAKIYRPVKTDIPQMLHFELHEPTEVQKQPPESVRKRKREAGPQKPSRQQIREVVETAILKKYAPPAVLMDAGGEVLYFHGNTSRFLSPPIGEPSFNLFQMIAGELHYRLSQAVEKLKRVNESVHLKQVQSRHDDSFLSLDVGLTPIFSSAGREHNWILVEFKEYEPPPAAQETEKEKPEAEETQTARERKLQSTLHAVKQELQATIEELETSNEELKSANEELQANNEELQSTNEELESSKEELQSTNEELETLNSELFKKNQDLLKAEDDLTNIFSASEIATVYLDTELRVHRFTPQAAELLNLQPADEGRPISDIRSNLEYDGLEKDSEEVLDKLIRKVAVVRSTDGTRYIMRVLPYRTSGNVIEGVVITFNDVSELDKNMPVDREIKHLVENTVAVLRDPILVLDASHAVLSANHAFYRFFKTSPKETLNRPIFELGGSRWDNAELRRFLEEILPENPEFEDYAIEHDFPRIGWREMAVSGRRIEARATAEDLILLAFRDRTQKGH